LRAAEADKIRVFDRVMVYPTEDLVEYLMKYLIEYPMEYLLDYSMEYTMEYQMKYSMEDKTTSTQCPSKYR
jgi:hypothetical protein